MVIGSIQLLNLQKKKLKYHIKIREIKGNFNSRDLNKDGLPVYNIEYNQRNGWHLTKNIHISDNESKKDSTTNNQPPPLLKDTNSPI